MEYAHNYCYGFGSGQPFSLTRTAFVFYRIAACNNIYMQRYIGSNRVTERTHNASKIPMNVYRVTG